MSIVLGKYKRLLKSTNYTIILKNKLESIEKRLEPENKERRRKP